MMGLSQIMTRVVAAMIFGSIMGLERELAGKEAGLKTEMLVAGGSALFTLISLNLPYVISTDPEIVSRIITGGGFAGIIANIVAGIGFLGTGIIIKTTGHVHGLTTAALVWTTGAIGIMAGLGMFEVALTSTILLSGMRYLLRHVDFTEDAHIQFVGKNHKPGRRSK